MRENEDTKMEEKLGYISDRAQKILAFLSKHGVPTVRKILIISKIFKNNQ